MIELSALMRALAGSQVVLFALALLLSGNARPVRGLGGLLSLGVLAYLAIPALERLEWPFVVQVAVYAASLTPVVLLLFVRQAFEDGSTLPRYFWLLVLVYAALLGAWTWPLVSAPQRDWLAWPLQLAKLGFSVATLWTLWRGRQHDLVSERLRLRLWFGVGLAATVSTVVLVELLAAWRVPAAVEGLGMCVIFIGALALNLGFLRWNPTFALQEPAAFTATVATDPMLVRLEQLMQGERLYADHDLRIGGLAERLGVPEHRLRVGINQELGHRNFNQFINGYRLQEAANQLLSDSRRPILSIALDVGFRSISSFNTAFRAHFGCTPTAYRAQAIEN